MAHINWLIWCMGGVALLLLYWITRPRRAPTRLPGHTHHCWVCQKTYTCPELKCTSDLAKLHSFCESHPLTRRDRAA
jgi:hypothetical protein